MNGNLSEDALLKTYMPSTMAVPSSVTSSLLEEQQAITPLELGLEPLAWEPGHNGG